jgi:magnesium-transporting ATPase (P-type)
MKELIENLQGYIQSNIDLAKLEVQEKIDQSIQKGARIGLLLLSAILSLVFLLISISILIGSLLENYFFGFGIVTLLLFSITVIIYFKYPNKIN